MTYEVTVTQTSEEVYSINVVISEDDKVLLVGNTEVCVATEDDAMVYAESVFIPDLRVNFKKVSELVLDSEVTLDDTVPEQE